MKPIYYHDAEAIKALFVGKSVVSAVEDLLTLSDGTVLEIEPNDGGCMCGGGDYHIDRLNTFANVITSVEVKSGPKNPDDEWSNTLYQIFVYSEGIGESVADISGDDGSGYYGTGFTIVVRTPQATPQAGDLRDGAIEVEL